MKLIEEDYCPPDKQRYIRGKSEYSPYIDYLMSGTPGKLAVECTDLKMARGLGHAISRYLQGQGKYDKLRPRIRKDSDTSVKVWVVDCAKEE